MRKRIIVLLGLLAFAIVLPRLNEGKMTQDEKNAELTKLGKVTEIVGKFSKYIPVVGEFVSAAFSLAQIAIEVNLPDDVMKELRDLGNALKTLENKIVKEVDKIKEICLKAKYNDIQTRTATIFLQLNQALRLRIENRTFHADAFLDSCSSDPPILDIYAFIDVLCNKLKSNGTLLEKEAAPPVKSVINIHSMMIKEMENYKSHEYFGKVEDIVEAVVAQPKYQDAKLKAFEILRQLRLIHTSDRFVVIVSKRCDVGALFRGKSSSIYANNTHKVIIYRSRKIGLMRFAEKKAWGVATRDVFLRACTRPNLSDLFASVHNIGFAAMVFDQCQMVIESDKDFFVMKNPFGSGHSLSCHVKADPRYSKPTRNTTFPGNILVYPP